MRNVMLNNVEPKFSPWMEVFDIITMPEILCERYDQIKERIKGFNTIGTAVELYVVGIFHMMALQHRFGISWVDVKGSTSVWGMP
ncbi:hypothetical protein Nepgr_011246 [Nepenthes gracilis]|uniref:Uncharacterized protein n=1 Tax=Nepenthes gracilis TaxID=150966 RepID=A0AAD3XM52_NEPGR|nr:hypothetical protein Nepgr_011246 [Nepenthes gracilis]